MHNNDFDNLDIATVEKLLSSVPSSVLHAAIDQPENPMGSNLQIAFLEEATRRVLAMVPQPPEALWRILRTAWIGLLAADHSQSRESKDHFVARAMNSLAKVGDIQLRDSVFAEWLAYAPKLADQLNETYRQLPTKEPKVPELSKMLPPESTSSGLDSTTVCDVDSNAGTGVGLTLPRQSQFGGRRGLVAVAATVVLAVGLVWLNKKPDHQSTANYSPVTDLIVPPEKRHAGPNEKRIVAGTKYLTDGMKEALKKNSEFRHAVLWRFDDQGLTQLGSREGDQVKMESSFEKNPVADNKDCTETFVWIWTMEPCPSLSSVAGSPLAGETLKRLKNKLLKNDQVQQYVKEFVAGSCPNQKSSFGFQRVRHISPD